MGCCWQYIKTLLDVYLLRSNFATLYQQAGTATRTSTSGAYSCTMLCRMEYRVFIWRGLSALLILYDHYFSGDDVDIEIFRRSFNRVLIPLYLHCRAYYMRTRWAPYSSVSFGGRLASKDCGLYFDFSTGVDWRINKDYHAYCSLGFWWSKFRYASGSSYERKNATHYDEDETCSSSDCPYRDRKYTNGDYYDHYHTTFYNIFRKKEGRGGLSFRIGISF